MAAAELTGMAPIVRPGGNGPEIIAPFQANRNTLVCLMLEEVTAIDSVAK